MKRTEAEETFVKLVTASGLPEADLWKAVLEAAGITVYLRNEAMGSLSGNVKETARSLGEFAVAAEDMKKAVEGLKQEIGKFKLED